MFSLDQFRSRSGSQGVVNGENLTCAVLPLMLQICGGVSRKHESLCSGLKCVTSLDLSDMTGSVMSPIILSSDRPVKQPSTLALNI